MSRLVCGMVSPILLATMTAMGFLAADVRPLEASRVRVDPEKELKGGEEREFEIADGVKMKFCWIPAGKATLGSPKEESDRPDEVEHEYVTKGFWLGKYLVTQAEWKVVMGVNPSTFQPDGKGKDKLQNDKIQDTSRFPVEQVSWNECQKFLEKMNKRNGAAKVFGKAGQFVLPHENEWEYACRGGKGNKQAFYFGNELNGTQANCKGTAPYGTDKKSDYKERTTEVGSYAKDWPHPWGLCDMNGNVWQWCENKYENTAFALVIRGGSWRNIASWCRSASRSRTAPTYRDNIIGFRVCFRLD
jgi:formylglycine-generating enzyme required for sulfatase activity